MVTETQKPAQTRPLASSPLPPATPTRQRVSSFHPKSANGVLVEILQEQAASATP